MGGLLLWKVFYNALGVYYPFLGNKYGLPIKSISTPIISILKAALVSDNDFTVYPKMGENCHKRHFWHQLGHTHPFLFLMNYPFQFQGVVFMFHKREHKQQHSPLDIHSWPQWLLSITFQNVEKRRNPKEVLKWPVTVLNCSSSLIFRVFILMKQGQDCQILTKTGIWVSLTICYQYVAMDKCGISSSCTRKCTFEKCISHCVQR